jgi:hypothetical protein
MMSHIGPAAVTSFAALLLPVEVGDAVVGVGVVIVVVAAATVAGAESD